MGTFHNADGSKTIITQEMIDNKIIRSCEEQLKKYRSISVGHFMETILKLPKDKMTIRRIRVKILENHKYIEDAEIDADGFHRIRYASKKPIKEKFWWLWPIIAFTVGLFVPAIQKSIEQRILQKSNQESPISPIVKDTLRKQ